MEASSLPGFADAAEAGQFTPPLSGGPLGRCNSPERLALRPVRYACGCAF